MSRLYLHPGNISTVYVENVVTELKRGKEIDTAALSLPVQEINRKLKSNGPGCILPGF